ncbi:malic enzyme-like NAD(P)-binding protein [Streptomyces sp. NPDC006602]|uniref:malic enzyme-like NAD(P)-binding protein n=1 Tax=Streptomyces sp. NPDC006602 TaxID=3364751 RepID=UPI0036B6554F
MHARPVLGRKQVPVAQANNVYVFPAVGLAVAACRASRVTDRMMVAAARAVGECAVRAGVEGATPLLPPLVGMRDAAREIALAVARAAVEDGVAPGLRRPSCAKRSVSG